MGGRWRCKKREVGEMAQTSLEEKGATEDEIVGWHYRLIIDSTGSEQTLGRREWQPTPVFFGESRVQRF